MPGRKQSAVFKIYVLTVCTAWFAVPVAALWGLDWRWIPTAFLIAMVALLLGGLVENFLHERAERRAEQFGSCTWCDHGFTSAEDRAAHRDAIAAEEEAWLGSSTDQPR